MTPGTPPNHGLPNATQSMRRLEAILSCGTKLRPNPTDQASRPAYYPSVFASLPSFISRQQTAVGQVVHQAARWPGRRRFIATVRRSL